MWLYFLRIFYRRFEIWLFFDVCYDVLRPQRQENVRIMENLSSCICSLLLQGLVGSPVVTERQSAVDLSNASTYENEEVWRRKTYADVWWVLFVVSILYTVKKAIAQFVMSKVWEFKSELIHHNFEKKHVYLWMNITKCCSILLETMRLNKITIYIIHDIFLHRAPTICFVVALAIGK